jgi:rare lipoprotein A
MNYKFTILALATLLLAACGTTPKKSAPNNSAPSVGGYLAGDGPGENAPANLEATPDAVPKIEPLIRYANNSYVALGKTYKPLTVVGNYTERGIASWYGKKFHGHLTTSGEIYDMYAMTAAHPTLPIPSYARVTNTANKKSVIVRINDRGPFLHDRVIDLSYTAALKLGIIGDGSAEVEVVSLAADAYTNPVVVSNPTPNHPAENNATANPDKPAAITTASIATAPVTSTSLENSDTSVYLQLGAFKSQEGAENFLEKMRGELSGIGKQFKLSTKDGLVRVHIGPYGSQSEARSSAESMESKLGFKPMLNLP